MSVMSNDILGWNLKFRDFQSWNRFYFRIFYSFTCKFKKKEFTQEIISIKSNDMMCPQPSPLTLLGEVVVGVHACCEFNQFSQLTHAILEESPSTMDRVDKRKDVS